MSSSFENPSVTPFTAFWGRARASPWKARCSRSSLLRAALSSPFSSLKEIPGGTGVVSLPFGPWTWRADPSIWTFTSLGMAMALRPTRDMSAFLSLPDVADDLAPHALLGGGPAGHEAAGGGEDVDAQAAVDPGDAVLAAVDAAAGAAHPLHVGDHPLHARAVLQVDAQHALLAVLVDLEVGDVALVLEDASDLDLQLGRGDVDLRKLGPDRIPDPGDHVRDGIGHVHGLLLPARLDHAGDFPGQGILPEADAAHLELPEIPPRPPAVAAPRVLAHGELRLALGLGNQGQLRHYLASCCVRNGMPRYWRRRRDSSSVRAVVTNVTFMPRSLSTFA